MFRSLILTATVFIGGYCLPSIAYADFIILDSGQKVTGQIMRRTELYVTMDVKGSPETYFLGEIANIDGKKVSKVQLPVKDTASASAAAKKTTKFKDEKDSLERFMERRNPKPPQQAAAASTSTSGDEQKIAGLVQDIRRQIRRMGNMNESAVASPDGGLIVVSPEKIVKYDKNLKVVKVVDLKPQPAPSSK